MTSPAIISVSAYITSNAAAAASLPNDGANFWYCSGFEITCAGATAGSIQKATVTGLLGGTLSYAVAVPNGVTSAAAPLVVAFPSALSGVGVSTDVVISMPAAGTGNAGASVSIHGYKGARQYNT